MFAIILAFLVCTASWAGESFVLGQHGSTLELPAGWERRQFDPSMGGGQFQHPSGAFLYVLEMQGTFLAEDDLVRRLELASDSISARFNDATMSEVESEHRGGLNHAWQKGWTDTLGLPIQFELHLVGQGGLGCLVTAWAGADGVRTLERLERSLPQAYTPPGDDSDWARAQEPVLITRELGRYTVTMSYPSPVFLELGEDERGDAAIAVGTADETVQIFLLLVTGDSAAGIIEEASEIVQGIATEVVSTRQSTMEVDGAQGQVVWFDGVLNGGPFGGAAGTFPVGDEAFLDLRMITYSDVDQREDLWRELLGSIHVELAPVLDAFPVAEERWSYWDEPLPQQLAFLEQIERVGSTPYGNHALVSPDGTVRVLHNDGAAILAPGGEIERWDVDLGYEDRVAAWLDGAVLVPREGDEVMRMEATGESLAGYQAAALTAFGDRGVLAFRMRAGPELLGIGSAGPPQGVELSLIAPDGSEEIIATLPGGPVSHAIAGERYALVAQREGDQWWGRPHLLCRVDLEDGTVQAFEPWAMVTNLELDGEGWLVTGQPMDERPGVYALDPQGRHSLLLSGDHAAAARLDDGALMLLTRLRLVDDPAERGDVLVYRVPAEVLAQHGVEYSPFLPSRIEAIAAEAHVRAGLEPRPELVLASGQGVSSLAAAARSLWLETHGIPAPASAEELDALIDAASAEESVSIPAWLVLTALAADHMLEAGATWVGGQQPFVAYGYYLEENDHAVGYLPADMVRSTFQDSEGWWSPVSTMNDGASGRRVVLGTDPAAVNAAVVALDRGELPEPERATAESVLAWLGPDQGNTWLRKSTWARLLLAQRVGLVVELAEPWAIAPEAVPGDLVAWLAARVLAGDYDHTDMVQQLRDAIEAHPREYGLYMILGQVYEQGDGPSGVELARLCYLEVSERGRWSELSPQAHAALERLDTVEE